MEFSKLILQRESCRNFSKEPVDPAAIEKCVDIARMSPSGCNSQPWYFVAVTESDLRAKLGAKCRIYGGNEYVEQAGALVAIFEVADPVLMPNVQKDFGCKHFAQGDVAMATVYLTLAAAEIGLASCILGTFYNAEVCELLGVPDGYICRVVVAVGHAAVKGEPRSKIRKPLEEVAKFLK